MDSSEEFEEEDEEFGSPAIYRSKT